MVASGIVVGAGFIPARAEAAIGGCPKPPLGAAGEKGDAG